MAKGMKPKSAPKGKMTMAKWEKSQMDAKMDKKGIAAYNKAKKKK